MYKEEIELLFWKAWDSMSRESEIARKIENCAEKSKEYEDALRDECECFDKIREMDLSNEYMSWMHNRLMETRYIEN